MYAASTTTLVTTYKVNKIASDRVFYWIYYLCYKISHMRIAGKKIRQNILGQTQPDFLSYLVFASS
jgi:hypothetical protein